MIFMTTFYLNLFESHSELSLLQSPPIITTGENQNHYSKGVSNLFFNPHFIAKWQF